MTEGEPSEHMGQEPMISVGKPGEPPPPGRTVPRKIESEEATEAQDYRSLYQDMDFVVRVTRELRHVLLQRASRPAENADPDADPSDDTLRSLWIAALVTYGRCFHKGKRRHLNESVFDGQPEAVLVWHRYFKDTRDKHIAHSVNPFEINATGVHVLDLDGESSRIEGVVNLYATRGLEQPEVVGYLGWLATYARDVMLTKHDEANNKVFEKAKSLSKEQLRRLPPLEEVPQMSFETAKKRRR